MHHLCLDRPIAFIMVLLPVASRFRPRPAFSATTGLIAVAVALYPRHTSMHGRPIITKCESNRESLHPSRQQQQLKKDESQSCDACLFVGMATCTGLSLYFVKLASEVPDRRSKAGFLTVSCFWAKSAWVFEPI